MCNFAIVHNIHCILVIYISTQILVETSKSFVDCCHLVDEGREQGVLCSLQVQLFHLGLATIIVMVMTIIGHGGHHHYFMAII